MPKLHRDSIQTFAAIREVVRVRLDVVVGLLQVELEPGFARVGQPQLVVQVVLEVLGVFLFFFFQLSLIEESFLSSWVFVLAQKYLFGSFNQIFFFYLFSLKN